MRWPWQRLERRESGFSSDLVQAAEAIAGGDDPSATRSAAVELASALWGRALAGATVDGDRGALTPALLDQIGRALVRRGEWVGALDVRDGMLRLTPTAYWTLDGDADPDRWQYTLTIGGPSGQVTRRVGAGSVLHVRYAAPADRPWTGRSPVASAGTTVRLLGNLESRLAAECGGPVGSLLAVPNTDGSGTIADSIKRMRGGAVLVETTAGGWDSGRVNAPQRDWTPIRVGAQPPEPLVRLHAQAAEQVLAACGVPIVLLQRSDGTALREGWRQFLFATIAPVARLLATEASTKLEQDVVLDFAELRASDLAGRARAFQSMVLAGMDASKAAALAGLMEDG